MGTPSHGAVRRSLLSASRLLPLLALLAALPSAAGSEPNLRILVDGRSVLVHGSVETVEEALEAAEVRLDSDDEVVPSRDAAPPKGGVIRVLRVDYTEAVMEAPVRHRTIVRPTTKKQRPYHPTVIKEGRDGLKRVTYRAKIVDGREVERVTLSEVTLREPEVQIVLSRNPTVLGSRGAYTGKRTLTMLATAYDPGAGSCGKFADGKTCNGKRAGYGIVAVDPKMIPLGTKLFIPGYGFGIAADVGSAIKGNRVDLGFNSRKGAMEWGKKSVQVQILD